MLKLKHLEMYDSEMFCDNGDVSDNVTEYVSQHEWHYDAKALAEVTCPDCLAYVAELGLMAQGVMFDAYQRMVNDVPRGTVQDIPGARGDGPGDGQP